MICWIGVSEYGSDVVEYIVEVGEKDCELNDIDCDMLSDLYDCESSGVNYDTVFNKKHEWGFRWLHENVGTNWRMTEMQAVIGIEALNHLEEWVYEKECSSVSSYSPFLIAQLTVSRTLCCNPHMQTPCQHHMSFCK